MSAFLEGIDEPLWWGSRAGGGDFGECELGLPAHDDLGLVCIVTG